MPKVRPFKAVRYNAARIKDISSVIAPPYDVISQRLQDELYLKNEHNFVRLELNKIEPSDNDNNNRYTRSRDLLQSWISGNLLTKDKKEAIYVYSMKYRKGAKTIEQIGFIGLMGLELKGRDKVLPHENTLAAPKEDRLSLIQALKANLSPIFVLYEDKVHKLTKILKNSMAKNKALIDVKSDKVRHRVWKVEDHDSIKKIADSMTNKDIFIADGHHRYEVSRAYYRQAQSSNLPPAVKENSKYMMVYFVEMDERMLTILPAHRMIKDIGGLDKEEILKRLGRYFSVVNALTLKGLLAKMSKPGGKRTFGAYLGNNEYYLLRLKSERDPDRAIKDKPREWKRLDVSILHKFVIQHVLGIRDEDDNIEFLKSAEETVRSVDSGKFKLAFFLNPTKVSEVKNIAGIGERMPRKATYFYPKPVSGLVINKF